MNKKISPVPALERGLDLLEWISLQSRPVTLTQIAQGLELSVSEVQRPVACLLEREYVKRTATGSYLLSGSLYQLACSHPPYLRIQQAALPLMIDFARQSGQSVHLSVPDRDSALLLADVPGGGLVRITLQAGARLNAQETVSGRILLAHEALISTKPCGKALASKLNKIRKCGHEMANSSYAAGIVDLGVPVRDSGGQVVAALTTSLLRLKKSAKDMQSLIPLLKSCAQNIARAL